MNIRLFISKLLLIFLILTTISFLVLLSIFMFVSFSHTEYSGLKDLNKFWNVGDISRKYMDNPVISENSGIKWATGKLFAGNCFVENSRGELNLFYYAVNKDTGVTSIGRAITKDGVNFYTNYPIALEAGEMGSWDDGGVSVFPGCIVQVHAGSYMMYYTGESHGSDIYHSGSIGVAFSDDLVKWEKYQNNPILTASDSGWDSWAVIEPSVEHEKNHYGSPDAFRMWYSGSNEELRFRIGYATSLDGLNWVKHTENPVFTFSNVPNEFDFYSVEVHDVESNLNEMFLFYEALSKPFPSRFSIGMASSKDGINWEKKHTFPIVEGGLVGAWDSMGAYHPSYVKYKNLNLLYYVGLDAKFRHNIGVTVLNPVLFVK